MENGDVAPAEHKEVGNVSENVVGLNGVTREVGLPVVDVVSEELSKDVDVIGDGTEAEAAADVVSLSNVPVEQHLTKHVEAAVASVVVEATFGNEDGHSAAENAADARADREPISDAGEDMIGNVDNTANAGIFEIVEDTKGTLQQQTAKQQWEPPQVVYQQEQEQQSLQLASSQELQPPAEQSSAAVSVAQPVTSMPSSVPSIQPHEDSQTQAQPENQLQPQLPAQTQLQAQTHLPPSQPQQQQQAVVYPQRTGSSYSVRIRLA